MANVRIPKRLKQRPHWKGLPIPYVTFIRTDGQPDFRVTDEEKRRSVIRLQLCQLCGQGLGKWFFFTGGTVAAEQNAYFEPACHLDCLIYAMQVCPFIVGKMEHAPIERVQQANPEAYIGQDDSYVSVKNPLWVIKKAVGWTHVQTKGGTILLQPEAIKQVGPLKPEEMTASDWKKVMDFLSAN